MFSALKKAFWERYIMPRALACLEEDPARVVEFVLSRDALFEATMLGMLSDRKLSQHFVVRCDTLFRHAEGNPNLEGKIAVAAARLAEERTAFRDALRKALYASKQWPQGVISDTADLAKFFQAHGKTDWRTTIAKVVLHRFVASMAPWLDGKLDISEAEFKMTLLVSEENELRRAFYEVLCSDGELPLRLGKLCLPDTHSFWPQLHEIFVREDYYFETDAPEPYIIDAGMHLGLATYYFKSRFPNAHIVGFEPSPLLRPVTEENMRRCGFEHVSVEPFALNRTAGTLRFSLGGDDTMAGTLAAAGNDAQAVEVEAVRLSPYLDRPVDFLKLDIEGAEGGVLEESANVLKNVHQLFIEYHERHDPTENSLPAILHLLDHAGFDYEVAKSHGYQLVTEHAPMKHVGAQYSAIVWAKNRVWPPAESV